MNRAKRILRYGLTGTLILLAVLTLVTHYLSADRFGRRIREELEKSLGRKVELGRVRFNLLTGPGFTVNDVVISELPSHGLAPFAYVDSLDARVRILSLLGGKLEFSTLRLVEPTINLVKVSDGPWNVQQLLMSELVRPLGAAHGSPTAMPEIQVRSGRVDFQIGTLKSAYYLTDTDFDLWEEDGGLALRFSGAPGRTDRPAQGFGRLIGNGRWVQTPGSEPKVDFDLQLDRSNLSDVVTLIQGRDVGVHGQIASQARLTGPVSNIRVTGKLQLFDVHRWDLLPPKGEAWPLNYEGRIDLRKQEIELESGRSDGKELPLAVRVTASNYFTTPQWAVSGKAKDFPASALIEVARHMGVGLPARAAGEGKLNGEMVYSSDAGVRGVLDLTEGSLEVPGTEAMRVPSARITVSGEEIRLEPATLLLHQDEKAVVEGEFRPSARSLAVRISTPLFRINDLKTGTGELLGAGRLPLLDNCTGGVWKGFVRYAVEGDEAPEWTGTFEVRDAAAAVPGLSDPVHLESAAVTVDGSRLQMKSVRGRAGKIRFEGDYRYEPTFVRPHRFRLVVAEAHAAELERLLLPSLQRAQGFLSRTLRIGRVPIPDWLKERRAAGVVQVASLAIGKSVISNLRADVIWDSIRVQLLGVEAAVDDTPISGTLVADLTGNVPEYQGSLRVDALESKLGEGELTAEFVSAGIGAKVLLERLRVEKILLTLGEEKYEGKGSGAGGGTLHADLTSGVKALPLRVTVFPFTLEPVEPAAAGKTP